MPIGAEDDFKGVVDLLTGKAMVWNEDDQGMTFEEVDVGLPTCSSRRRGEYREQLVEAVCRAGRRQPHGEVLRGSRQLTEAEMVNAIRKATIAMDLVP